MKELGAYLRRTRIKNGVSITEACEDLDFSTSHLENIESGNVKAFKDIYELKESIRQYSKYLGLDPDKVIDEFNGFLFEHTSKISLDDIIAAQNTKTEEKKVKSPYTKEVHEKTNPWPVFIIVSGILLLTILLYIIIANKHETPARTNELKGYQREDVIYEFTY